MPKPQPRPRKEFRFRFDAWCGGKSMQFNAENMVDAVDFATKAFGSKPEHVRVVLIGPNENYTPIDPPAAAER